MLRVTHENGVLLQVWSVLTAYQLLQDLRMRIAERHDWREDDVSWHMLVNRIGWYLERPEAQALEDWLVERAAALQLQKRGVRPRRAKALPDALLRETMAPAAAFQTPFPLRKPRQGKPQPRKKMSHTVLANLNVT